eukprot:TRINITY_DN15830_c0_g1_i1.p1 TRINITY_DN15830_c0_g1~~TRINITY_DN15830_c0_g1_i1.p1  ORF type:complete len:370 (+),score=37.15 TRINITY_DN15830_c0_g1_i1:61-1110(+)
MDIWKAATVILGIAVLLQSGMFQHAVPATQNNELLDILTESSMLWVKSEMIQMFIQGGLLQKLSDNECTADVLPHEDRILRALEFSEHILERKNAKWCLTPRGKAVAALQHWIVLQQHLQSEIREGFTKVSQKDFYSNSAIFSDPDLRILFSKAMDDLTKLQLPVIGEMFNRTSEHFKERDMLCDIGGGAGGLVQGIVSQGFFRKGVSLDADQSALDLANSKEAEISGVKYDLFKGFPNNDTLLNCNAVTLKGISSDYSDLQLLDILRTTSQSFPGVPILVIDHFLVPPTSENGKQLGFLYQMDVMMMALFGESSKQRSPSDIIAIASELGLEASYFGTLSPISGVLIS